MLGHKGYWDPKIKASGTEGGLRNHLAVAGPGVPSGAKEDTLLSLADVLPTVADLAGAKNTKHLPWSGNSFANLLKPAVQPTKQQQERFFFTMTASGDAKACPHAATLMRDTLPQLGRDRWGTCLYELGFMPNHSCRSSRVQPPINSLVKVACLTNKV
jgi:arylsulfatase A-like enzyme